MMRRLFIGVAALAVVAAGATAYAVEDPIFTRKSLMDANGAAAGAGVAMLKEQIPFNPGVAKSVFATTHAVAYSYGDYFPAGSDTGNTKASPKIWEDAAGFAAALEKFQKDTDAALAADVQDLDAFKAAFGQVASNCQSCHDSFRLPNN
jgi:cytochrome c556